MDVPVQEKELATSGVKVGVDVALRGDGGQSTIVEEPDRFGRGFDQGQSLGPGVGTRAVDATVEGIVEEQVSVATTLVAGTDPEASGRNRGGIGPPRSGTRIGRDADGDRQIDIPRGIRGDSVGRAVGRQTVVVIDEILVGCEAPVAKVGAAGNSADLRLGLGGGGGNGACQNEDDRDDDEKLEESEPRPRADGAVGFGFAGEVHTHRYIRSGEKLHERPSNDELTQTEIISISVTTEITNNTDMDMNINYVVVTYTIYLGITVPLTIWVAKTLFQNGRLFLIDSYHGNVEFADSVNRLLLVGFYLLNIGYVTLALRFAATAENVQQTIEAVSVKVGLIMVVLGCMHMLNLFVFTRIRRRAIAMKTPPSLPIVPLVR